MNEKKPNASIARRFRGFLPVVVDIETAGLNSETDAVLEIAAIILDMNEDGSWFIKESLHEHVQPFKGANLDKEALEFNKIDPYHPFRFAKPEKEVLENLFGPIKEALKKTGCKRAVLVGHNAWFDLFFLKAAIKRCKMEGENPFHKFTSFDTATLAGLALKQTVLAVACKKAGLDFQDQNAHSALYDATKTAELFCYIVNRCRFDLLK